MRKRFGPRESRLTGWSRDGEVKGDEGRGTEQGEVRDEGGGGGAGHGVTLPRHRRMAAMLRLQRSACVWTSGSSRSSSLHSIGFTSQVLVPPRAATLRIRNSSGAWGRPDHHHHHHHHHQHQTEDSNSWTQPPPPPFPLPIGDGPPRIQTSSPPPSASFPQPPPLSHQGESSSYYYLLYLHREQNSLPTSPSVSAAWPVEKMNSKKDMTLPISSPPAVGVPKEEQKLKRMTRQGAMVALAYMACAVMLVMFNKAALSSYKFPCANIITVLQMVCSTALLYVLRKLDVINFANDGNAIIEPSGDGFVPFRIVKKTSPLSIAYLFYMVVGMASIRGVNVPMYTTLRRTTVLFTMVFEYFLTGQRHSSPIVSSVGLIVVGALIAGARDLSFDAQGYMVVLVSNLTTAMYLTTISRLGKSTGLNSFGLMWCNGIICGPILLLWTILNGELSMALQFPAVFLPGFQLVILLSCILAFALNYTIFLNTSLNSPLTQTMCGNLKDFGTILIGWIWFGGLPFDWLNVLGQFLGFFGSGLYAYCKLKGI